MANISKIKLPNNTTYNIKDDSAITSISKNHNNITITYRDGTTSTINDPYYDSIYATEIQGGDLIVTGSARFLNTINGSISGNAATATSATKATQDGNGAVISTTYLKVAQKGVANGLAELDANGIIVSSQLPSFVDDVIEGYYYNNKFYKESTHTTQITGETGKIYVNLESGTDQNKTYRWSGSAFVVISETLALGETSSTAYRGDRGKTAYNHATDSSRLTTATASGLYKVASTAQGHIASLTAITKADITGLGIPGSDTDRYVNSAAFADATSADASNPVKMTLTRAGSDTASVTAYIPKVSSSSAGVVPKGTTVSSQSQTTKFLREDGTWATPSYTPDTNTTYTLGTSGNTVTLTPSSGSVQSITVPYATSAGSATDNTKVAKAGDTMSGTLTFNKVTNGISYTGTKTTYPMIRFIDNTSDAYGNGIAIGGGGQTIIGGGESSDAMIAQAGTSGTEIMYIGNDTDVNIFTNLQNGWSNRKTFTFDTSGNLTALKFIGALQGNADTATKATQDASGNVITTTYATKSGVVGNLGNLTSLGGGTSATATKTYWENNIDNLSHQMAYNNSGTEYTILFNRGINANYGTILKWGYADKYLRILRKSSGSWVDSDWAKISAGYADSAGSATSATTASKLGSSNVGSATQPIYLASGTATACTYTLSKSVPSDAVFTDTKNTAGSTDTSSKIYLIGATSQAANPQTYSDNEVYTTSGVLTTKSVQVGGGSATMQYNANTQSIDFVFAS